MILFLLSTKLPAPSIPPNLFWENTHEHLFTQPFTVVIDFETSNRLSVCFFLYLDTYPSAPAVVSLKTSPLDQRGNEALVDFLQDTANEQAGQPSLFTIVTEALDYLSSLPPSVAASDGMPNTSTMDMSGGAASADKAQQAKCDARAASTSSPPPSNPSPAASICDPSATERPSAAEAAGVCRFYKQGKCRFGAECRSIHPGAKKQRPTPDVAENQAVSSVTPVEAPRQSGMVCLFLVVVRFLLCPL